MQGDVVPAEGQAGCPALGSAPRKAGCRAASRSAGCTAKRSASLSLLGGERYLGVDLGAELPGRLQALEGGAVVKAGFGDAVIEVLGCERLGSRRGPGVASKSKAAGSAVVRVAGGVAGEGRLLFPILCGAGLGAGVDRELVALLVLLGG